MSKYPNFDTMTDEEIAASLSGTKAPVSVKETEPLKPFESQEERVQAHRSIVQELQKLQDYVASQQGTARSKREENVLPGISVSSDEMKDELSLYGNKSPLSKTLADAAMRAGNMLGAGYAGAAVLAKEALSGEDYDAIERLKAIKEGAIDSTVLDVPYGLSSEFEADSTLGKVGLFGADLIGGALSGKGLQTLGKRTDPALVKASYQAGRLTKKAIDTAKKVPEIPGKVVEKAKDLSKIDVKGVIANQKEAFKQSREVSKALKENLKQTQDVENQLKKIDLQLKSEKSDEVIATLQADRTRLNAIKNQIDAETTTLKNLEVPEALDYIANKQKLKALDEGVETATKEELIALKAQKDELAKKIQEYDAKASPATAPKTSKKTVEEKLKELEDEQLAAQKKAKTDKVSEELSTKQKEELILLKEIEPDLKKEIEAAEVFFNNPKYANPEASLRPYILEKAKRFLNLPEVPDAHLNIGKNEQLFEEFFNSLSDVFKNPKGILQADSKKAIKEILSNPVTKENVPLEKGFADTVLEQDLPTLKMFEDLGLGKGSIDDLDSPVSIDVIEKEMAALSKKQAEEVLDKSFTESLKKQEDFLKLSEQQQEAILEQLQKQAAKEVDDEVLKELAYAEELNKKYMEGLQAAAKAEAKAEVPEELLYQEMLKAQGELKGVKKASTKAPDLKKLQESAKKATEKELDQELLYQEMLKQEQAALDATAKAKPPATAPPSAPVPPPVAAPAMSIPAPAPVAAPKPAPVKAPKVKKTKDQIKEEVKDLSLPEKKKAVKKAIVDDFLQDSDEAILYVKQDLYNSFFEIGEKMRAKGLPQEAFDQLTNTVNTMVGRSVAGKKGYFDTPFYNEVKEIAKTTKLEPKDAQALEGFISVNLQKNQLELTSEALSRATLDLIEFFDKQLKTAPKTWSKVKNEVDQLKNNMVGYSKVFKTLQEELVEKKTSVISKEELVKNHPNVGPILNKAALNIVKKQSEDVEKATMYGKGRYSKKNTKTISPEEEVPVQAPKKEELPKTPVKVEEKPKEAVKELPKPPVKTKPVEVKKPAPKAEEKPKEQPKVSEADQKEATRLKEMMRTRYQKQLENAIEELKIPGLSKKQMSDLEKEIEYLKKQLGS
jgi:hypothetical protein